MKDAKYYPTRTALLGAFFHRLSFFFYIALALSLLFVFSEYTFLFFWLPLLFGVAYASIYVFISTLFSYTFTEDMFVKQSAFSITSYNPNNLLFIRVDESFPLSLVGAKKYFVAFPEGVEVLYTPSYINVENWFDIGLSKEDTVIRVEESVDEVFTYFFVLLLGISFFSLTWLLLATGNVFGTLLVWIVAGLFGVTWLVFTDVKRDVLVSEHGVLYRSPIFPKRSVFIPRYAVAKVSSTFSTVSFILRDGGSGFFGFRSLYPSSFFEIDLVFDRGGGSLVFPVSDIEFETVRRIRVLLGLKEER